MKPKKSIKADLESKKGIFIQLGLIVAMSLTLIAFEWTTLPEEKSELSYGNEITFDTEIVSTQRNEPEIDKPEPKLPDVAEVLDIVDDDVDVPDFNFENEVDDKTNIDIRVNEDDGDDEKIKDDEIFVVVEDMPLFNGGDPKVEFMKYISKHVEYPRIPAENGIGGRVSVQFVVNEEGEIVNATIIRSVDPELDKEALRVVNSSPRWTPGKQRGKPAKVIYTFPINFKLQ